MKKIGIMQPYFFPYIAYWQLINAVDEYVVYDDVAYIKGGWINRNNILVNNYAHMITLPLDGASSFKNINEIYVTTNMKAKEKLCKTIAMSYSKAPYFNDIYPMIENLIKKEGVISEIIYEIILQISDYLGFKTKILMSSQIPKNNELKAEKKVIDIVKNLSGNVYINAIGGSGLYNKESFAKEGIELKFIKTLPYEYKQFGAKFVSGLSIIDILMFNSKEIIKELLNDYELL